jgi:hypothetical protein
MLQGLAQPKVQRMLMVCLISISQSLLKLHGKLWRSCLSKSIGIRSLPLTKLVNFVGCVSCCITFGSDSWFQSKYAIVRLLNHKVTDYLVGSVWRCVERLKFANLVAVEFANNYDILLQDCLV